MSPTPNPRFELRAYEHTNSCRLAAILRELASRFGTVVPREAVKARWAELSPRHADQTGSKSITNRLSNGLTLLKVAGIAHGDGPNIVVTNQVLLEMAANNLAIVQDNEGVAIRPGLWERRPEVPEHLLPVQSALEQERTGATTTSELWVWPRGRIALPRGHRPLRLCLPTGWGESLGKGC